MGIAISTGHRGFVLLLLFTTLVSNTASARNFQLSTEVMPQEVSVLKHDLGNDLTLNDEAETKAMMGVSDLSDSSLKLWLLARVEYIIGETENESEHLVSLRGGQYQNPEIFPKFEQPVPSKNIYHQSAEDKKKSEVDIIMANRGISYYYMGKTRKTLLGYKFQSVKGSQTVPIVSPRVGFLQVGKGLFSNLRNQEKPDSIVNTWFRLATLFHEAHHSDGNGKSLGFPHGICPSTSGQYAGYNACDRELNGPYGIEAQLIRQVRRTCLDKKTCSAGEGAMLEALAMDSHSRIINTSVLDTRPESFISQGGDSGI